jgi:hypothetical protein
MGKDSFELTRVAFPMTRSIPIFVYVVYTYNFNNMVNYAAVIFFMNGYLLAFIITWNVYLYGVDEAAKHNVWYILYDLPIFFGSLTWSAIIIFAGTPLPEKEKKKRYPDHHKGEDDCKICLMDHIRLHCLVPCGHTMMCRTCAKGMRKCPTCRSEIDLYVPIYM